MIGPLFILLAAVLWAFDGVLRRSLFSLPPITIVFLEHVIGLIFLSPWIQQSVKQFLSLRRQDQSLIAWVALFSSVLGTLWFTTALLAVNFIPFSVVFLLQKLQPIFVIGLSVILLKEKMTKQYFIWAGVALIAAYFVTFPGGKVVLSFSDGTLRAAGFALLAAFAWGTSTVFSRMMLAKLPDTTVTTLRFLLASMFAGAMVVAFGKSAALASVTPNQLLTFIIIALSTGMMALWIYYKGLARTPASIATILELVFPMTAVVIDIFVYKTSLAWSQYLAIAVLLLSAYQLSTQMSAKVIFETSWVKGKGRGKFLGYPTVNLQIPKKLTAQDGIYAAWVTINKKKYQGALHFGPVPTFQSEAKSLEVFLLDTKTMPAKTLTKGKIKVEFVRWLRPVMKFDTPEILVEQITKDVAEVKVILSQPI